MFLQIFIILIIAVCIIFVFYGGECHNMRGGGRTLNLEEAKVLCDADPNCAAIKETANGFIGTKKGTITQVSFDGTQAIKMHYNKDRQRLISHMKFTKVMGTVKLLSSSIYGTTVMTSDPYGQKIYDYLNMFSIYPPCGIAKVGLNVYFFNETGIVSVTPSTTDFYLLPIREAQTLTDTSIVLSGSIQDTGLPKSVYRPIYSQNGKTYVYSNKDVLTKATFNPQNTGQTLLYPYMYI